MICAHTKHERRTRTRDAFSPQPELLLAPRNKEKTVKSKLMDKTVLEKVNFLLIHGHHSILELSSFKFDKYKIESSSKVVWARVTRK